MKADKNLKTGIFPALVIFLLSAHLMTCILSLKKMSVTYDEPLHFKYGSMVLQRSFERSLITLYGDSKMPVSVLNVLPYSSQEGVVGRLSQFQKSPTAGRMVTIVASMLAGLVLLLWATEMYGRKAGLLALFLYSFSPNIIAHARVVTTDLYITLFALFTLYTYWRFLQKPSWSRVTLSAVALGCAQVTKYTAIFLYPVLILIAVVYYTVRLKKGELKIKNIFARRTLLRLAGILAIFAACSLLIINIGFLFQGTNNLVSSYKFQSEIFRRIAQHPYVSRIPLPLPQYYVAGIDWSLMNERMDFMNSSNNSFGNVYLFGQLKQGQGFPGYFIWAYFVKEPLAIQILLLWAYAVFLTRSRHTFWKDELFIVAPLTVLGVYFNFLFNAQIGIRFILPLLPLTYLFAASLMRSIKEWKARYSVALAILGVYYLASVFSYFPHFISYFNELVWDRKSAYRILADSNIDWGQSNLFVKEFRETHPEYKYEPEIPTPGKIIVGVNMLTGVFSPEKYKWLRENFKPYGHVAYAFLLFNVSEEKLRQKQLMY